MRSQTGDASCDAYRRYVVSQVRKVEVGGLQTAILRRTMAVAGSAAVEE